MRKRVVNFTFLEGKGDGGWWGWQAIGVAGWGSASGLKKVACACFMFVVASVVQASRKTFHHLCQEFFKNLQRAVNRQPGYRPEDQEVVVNSQNDLEAF